MNEVLVRKLAPDGMEIWRYPARRLRGAETWVLLEAFFSRDDWPLVDVVLRRGDRFLEAYFSDRWYNVFAIYAGQTDCLKGYYCNIGRPAVITPETVSYVDLALDLWVAPDGTMHVLDADEFAALNLDAETRSRALAALRELQASFWHVVKIFAD